MLEDPSDGDAIAEPVAPVAPPPAPDPIRLIGVRSWVLASATVGALAAVVDVALGRAGPASFLYAAGLGLGAGAVHGLLAGGLAAGLRRLPGWVGLIVWPGLLLAGAAALASDLGAWSRLEGKDRLLAVAALALCGGGGLAFGLLFAGLQPRKTAPRGLLGGLRLRWRAPLAGLLVLVAAGALFADHRFFADGYPMAHLALRLAAFWAFTLALLLAGVPMPRVRRPAVVGALWGAGAVAALVPFFGIRKPLDAHAIVSRPLAGLALRALRTLVDFDRDGYSALLAGGDCAELDGAISPDAPEIPGNGIDDNCLGGDGEYVDPAKNQDKVPVPEEPSPVNVVLITIDTVRWDHTSAFGYERDTTPNLKRLADQSTRFDHAYTSGGWTSIALSSLMRGLYPRRLRWTPVFETNHYRLLRSLDPKGLERGESFRLGFALPINDPHHPLAWWLRRRGMWTAALVDDGYSQFLDRRYASQGFTQYHLREELKNVGPDDVGTADAAIATLKDRPKDKPFFLWVHFFGPHNPSSPHKDAPTWGKAEPDRYDEEIWFADRQAERVLEAAQAASTDRPLVTIVTADHGEHLRDARQRDHGNDLLEPSIHIPMIVRGPGFPAGGHVEQPVSLVDILPTILGLTGTPGPEGLDGVDLRRIVANDATATDRVLLAETWRFSGRGKTTLDRVGVFDGRRKYVLDRLDNDLGLFDQSDTGEHPANLLEEESPGDLETALRRYLDETGGTLRLSR